MKEESNQQHQAFMARAVALSIEAIEAGTGGPFGCVIVKDGLIIAEGKNCVTSTNDPSAHAEVDAIRKACQHLNNHQLIDCILYTSCEPCPMCLGAIYWAKVPTVYYANTNEEAASAGFDDGLIYKEIEKPINLRSIKFSHLPDEEAAKAFQIWKDRPDKIEY